ncbi:hypothetical protein [Sphingomonas sp. NPDC092410]|uniref:hypothetical protein n=2 Tax=unclassified Sphingomonas TaxID=196159 RepID=UPI003D02EEF5
MLMNLVLAALLAPGTLAIESEWAPIGINGDGDTLYLVDRASIKAGPETMSGMFRAVSQTSAFGLHLDFDCAAGRFRYLDYSNPNGDLSGASGWSPVKPGTPLHLASKYICAAGKIDLGFGDATFKAERPEPFARRFLELRSRKN